MDNKIEELLKKHNIELSTRLYNRTSKDWNNYRVERFDSYRGKTKIPYFSIKFKESSNYTETSLKNIIDNTPIDLAQQKKLTKKKVKAKKKQAKIEKKESKKFIMHFNEEPTVMALDMSAKSTGYSIKRGDKLLAYGYIFQSPDIKPDTRRINGMKKGIEKLIDKYNVNCVFFEDIILHHKYTLYVLSKLQGVIADMLLERDLKYISIPVLEWKTGYNINRGRSSSFDTRIASKEKTVWCVNKDYGLDLEKEYSDYDRRAFGKECPAYDVADSLGLLDYGIKNRIAVS